MISIVTCFSVATFQTYSLFHSFFSYSKVTQIKEHTFKTEEDLIFPNIQVCNVNPGGLLRHMPQNETITAFYDVVVNRTTCTNCSKDEKGHWDKIRQMMLGWGTYTCFLGVEKAKGLMQNTNEFLVECIMFPLKDSCFEAVNITVLPLFQYFCV